MRIVTAARYLMGTRFEIALAGETDASRLRSAGEIALDEIERLDRQLSFYRPESDLSRLNRGAATGAVRIDPRVFELLSTARSLSEATGGAFDPTVAPLLRAWGFVGARGSVADAAELSRARMMVGMNHVRFDPGTFEVSFDREGVEIDLGSIGKGYAVDQALELLREMGITRALVHGGTSTVGALGTPPEDEAWSIGVAAPPGSLRSSRLQITGDRLHGLTKAEESESRDAQEEVTAEAGQGTAESDAMTPARLAVVRLRDGEALSVSALHEKGFTGPDGRVYGHVLDPRTGEPVQGALLAAVAGRSATETDALSTALLVLGQPGDDPAWARQSTLIVDAGGRIEISGRLFEV